MCVCVYLLVFYLWFTPAYWARLYGARFVISGQYFAHTAMRNEQLARDIARTNAHLRKLDNSSPNLIRKRPTVDEHPTKLVNTSLPCNETRIHAYRQQLLNIVIVIIMQLGERLVI